MNRTRSTAAVMAAAALIVSVGPIVAHATGAAPAPAPTPSTTITRCKSGPGGTVICPGRSTPGPTSAPTPTATATPPANCRRGPGGTWRCPGGVTWPTPKEKR